MCTSTGNPLQSLSLCQAEEVPLAERNFHKQKLLFAGTEGHSPEQGFRSPCSLALTQELHSGL
jgi:hypothetical protein